MRTIVLPVVAVLLLPLALPAQTTQPARYAAAARADARINTATALSRTLPEIRMADAPLDSAIDFIRDLTQLNIHVNWRALEMLNVTRETPVSLQLANVSARRILRALLDQTGAGEHLTWYIDDGVVEITTREIADSKLITKVYPVEDLVLHVPDFSGPTFNLQNQSSQTSGQGGGGGGGGGQSLFGGNSGGGSEGTRDTPVSKAERADGLVKLIQDTVRPEVWRDNGGVASIRYFNGHLIVTAPRSVHEAISTR